MLSLRGCSHVSCWALLFTAASSFPFVETRTTPLALSLSRHRTVSSRDHEKFLSFQTTMALNGGASAGGVLHHPLEVLPASRAVIVPGCDPEAVDVAVAFAFASLELSRVLPFGITGGLLDIDCGVLYSAAVQVRGMKVGKSR